MRFGLESLRTNSVTLREFLGELLGTFVLTTLGCSANAYITVANERNVAHVIAPWAWGMALTAAIYVSGGVSGGHVNPAVTLGLASVGKISWRKIFHFFAAQYIGAFLGACTTYLVYHESIRKAYKQSKNQSIETAGIFGTFPHKNVSTGTEVVDQIVASAFFLLLINAICDDRNMAIPKGLKPIAIGVTDLTLMIFAFGFNCGAPLNPARDFVPRLFTLMAGWGKSVFSASNYYFWVPLVCCHIGGVIGSWIYKLMIELHWPDSVYDLTDSKLDEKIATLSMAVQRNQQFTFPSKASVSNSLELNPSEFDAENEEEEISVSVKAAKKKSLESTCLNMVKSAPNGHNSLQ